MDNAKYSVGVISHDYREILENYVLDFVYSRLSHWRDMPTRDNSTESEPALTTQLCKYLMEEAHYAEENFSFLHQHQQTGRATVDVAAISFGEVHSLLYSDDQPIIVFETKRFPLPGEREKEYITRGDSLHPKGGIQRFKLKVHGANHTTAAIIGFIQKHDAQYFFEIINKWIIELCNDPNADIEWHTLEQLCNFKFAHNGTARAESEHPRNNSDPIKLHHLCVVM